MLEKFVCVGQAFSTCAKEREKFTRTDGVMVEKFPQTNTFFPLIAKFAVYSHVGKEWY